MMKKKIIVAGILYCTLFTNAFSQTETFDIATFIAPKQWQRIDSNGVLVFHNYKTVNNQTSFCQIFLFASSLSNSNPVKNFQAEWSTRVVKPTGTKEKPKTQTEITPEGWTAVTGSVKITVKGVTYTSILVSTSGFGRVISMLVNIAGEEYLTDVQNFFEKVDFNPNAMPNNNQQAPASLSNYIYSIPMGWGSQQYPDAIVLSSQVSNTGEKCNIALWQMRPASGNLQNDAVNLFNEVFKVFQLTNSSTPNSMIKGISPQGWEYFIIKNAVKVSGGDYQTMFGFAFVARLGNQLAAISGMSKDPLVSSCFGLQLTDVWPKFLYSLQFKNWKIPAGPTALSKKIPAVWMAVTGSSGDRFAFAANGRYAGASAAQRYYILPTTELLRVTDFSFGDGAYSIHENGISFIKDNEKNKTEKGLLRIEQESKDGGRTWVEKLYLLRKSVVDGSDYEVPYEKQNN
jgi:hypothetical protein